MNSTIKQIRGKCIDCSPDVPEQVLIAKRCSRHYWKYRSEIKNSGKQKVVKPRKAIPKVSEKRKIENRKYTIERLRFLAQPENQKCPVTGKQTTDIHHMKGRIGSLLLDTRFWIAVSREGHKQIEENPEWAKENGYSQNRVPSNNIEII